MSKHWLGRGSLALVLVAGLALLTGCLNLGPVKDYADKSVTFLGQEDLGQLALDSAQRMKDYNDQRLALCAEVTGKDCTKVPEPQVAAPAAPQTTDQDLLDRAKDLDKVLTALQDALAAYYGAVASLADDKELGDDSPYQELLKQVLALPQLKEFAQDKVVQDGISVAEKLLKLLVGPAITEYRRHHLKKIMTQADPLVEQLTKGLEAIVTTHLVNDMVGLEIDAVGKYYDGVLAFTILDKPCRDWANGYGQRVKGVGPKTLAGMEHSCMANVWANRTMLKPLLYREMLAKQRELEKHRLCLQTKMTFLLRTAECHKAALEYLRKGVNAPVPPKWAACQRVFKAPSPCAIGK